MKGINMGENGKKSIFKKVLWSMGAVMTGAILISEISSLLLIHKDGQRAQELLEQYVKNVGDAMGKTYEVSFVIADEAGTNTVSTDESDN